MSIHSSEITAEEAEANTRNYTTSVQEQADEQHEEVDRTPITDEQRQRLDERTDSTFQSPFDPDASQSEPAQTFQPPSKWVSPVMRQRERQRFVFPSERALNDLDERVAAAVSPGGAPKPVQTAERKAREAIAAARQARTDGGHPDNPRYAVSVEAKDNAAVMSAKAVQAVAALEAAAEENAEEWFDGLVADLPAMRAKAARALETASKAYSEWRNAIAAADTLAREQGRFADWHHHPDEREIQPLRLVEGIRRARDIAKSEDDYFNGDYLTTEYDGIPPHTAAALEASARRAPGSFAEQVFLRLKNPHPTDGPVKDALEARDLRIVNTLPIPVLTPQQSAWDAHARAVDPSRS